MAVSIIPSLLGESRTLTIPSRFFNAREGKMVRAREGKHCRAY
jgi:hypothetical protein